MEHSDPIALEAVRLVRFAVWPGLALLALLLFHSPLTRLLDRLQNVTAKKSVDGFEIALAASALQAAESTRGGVAAASPEDVAKTVTRVAKERAHSRQGPSVLWVDDEPENNALERASLKAVGVRFTLARSTDEARPSLDANIYDAVISDFARPNADNAYALLELVRSKAPSTPVIIYSGTAEPNEVQEAKSRGAYGQTNRPSELFSLLMEALERS
jgi:CheY-like chemotaxis protein